MTSVRQTLDFTQSEDLVEPLSSFHFPLEPSSPDSVKEVSKSTRDQACDDPADAESDSGDSLFLTQNPAPEAQRSRQHYHSQRSQPASIRKQEGEDSSSSQEESNTVKKRSRTKGKKFRLPQYSFPFLPQRSARRARLSARHNTALHHCAMGGFFKCLKELQQARQRGDDPLAWLPTVDVEGECIFPLSEDEEEGSDSVDIKVVERKRFVFTPSNAKRSQKLKKGGRVNGQQRTAGKGRRGTVQHQIPAEGTRFSSRAESSDDEGPSQSLTAEREMGDKHVTNNRNIVAHSETPATERGRKKYTHEKEREEELCDDSDATYCETLEPQRRPGPQEASLHVTDGPADVFLTDDPSQVEQAESEHGGRSLRGPASDADNESVCNNTRVDKERNSEKEGDDEGWTPRPTEENRAEPPETHAGDEPEYLSREDVTARQEEGGHLESEMRAEEEESSLASHALNGGEDEKKKKKKKQTKGVVADETLKSCIVSEPLEGDGEILTKKKKRKKEKIVKHEEVLNMKLEETVDCLKNTESTQEGLEPIVEKKRKKHKKKQRSADQDDGVKDLSLAADESTEGNTAKKKKTKEKKKGSSSEEASCISAPESAAEKKKRRGSTSEGTFDENQKVDDSQKTKEGVDVRDTESVTKKKKKKKRRESTSEAVDVYCTADKTEEVAADHLQTMNEGSDHRDAESGTKKKKKKKKRETLSRAASEDAAEQGDDSVSVPKKKKARTSSFLDADAEEKDAQTHEEQNWPRSNSAAAPVSGAGKSGVSAGAPETESATVEEANNVVRKKKRKRKAEVEVEERLQKSCDQDFEEPGKVGESFLPDAAKMRVKRKRKSRGNESESSTAVEGLGRGDSVGCSPTNGAVVLRKKKKKKSKSETDHVTQESFTPATDRVESAVSHKKKSKRSTAPSAREERLVAEECCAKIRREKQNNPQQASPSAPPPGVTCESVRIKKNKKHKQAKTKLYGPSESLFTDLNI